MPETNITGQTAPIYAADLLYEQNCKCGTTEVLGTGAEWSAADASERVWKIVILDSGHATDEKVVVFSSIVATNISIADCTKIVEARYVNGQEILGNFTQVGTAAGEYVKVILYKDCCNS